MRFLRKLIGVVMIMVAVPALFVGGAGWLAGGHRDPNGAFTADLAPLPWRLEPVQSGALRPAHFAHEFPRRVDPPPLVLFGFLRI